MGFITSSIRRWMPGILIISGIYLLYYGIFGRLVLSRAYTFGGDTYFYWSFRHFILDSIRHYNQLPWWDPTNFGGYPLYYYFLSGWSNYLSPYYLPSLLLFKTADSLFGVTIYGNMLFHQTVWVVVLNITAIYLIARELTTTRSAAALPPFIFAFSYYQMLNFHDYYAYEAMIAPLFYLWALTRFNNRRTGDNLAIFMLFTGFLLASLQNGIVMSSFYWTFLFTVILIIFNPGLLKDTLRAARELCSSRHGTALFSLLLLMCLAGVAASWSPFHINSGHILKYKGGHDGHQPVAYDIVGGLTDNYNIPMKTSEIWTIIMNWLPFPDVHDALLRFTGDGHENRYIGLITLPLLIAAFTLCLRNKYVYILFLTYFICNAFIIYATGNLAYRILTDNFDIFRNVANISTIFPRGGPSLMLVFAAAIGLDRLISVAKRQEAEGYGDVPCQSLFKRVQYFIACAGIVLVILCIVASHYPLLNAVRHTLGHAGVYLLLFASGLLILFNSNSMFIRKTVFSVLLVLTFMDLVSGESSYLTARAPLPGSGYNYGFPSGEISRNVLIPLPDVEKQGVFVPENTTLKPARSEQEIMFPGDYRGVFHNWRRINWSTKEWLVLATRPEAKAMLPNWNHETANPTGYPVFMLVSNGFYEPLETLRAIDQRSDIFLRDPLFHIHDRKLAQKYMQIKPQWTNGSYAIDEYTPNRVIMRTQSAAAGFLYFLDNYDEYWNAYLDGTKVTIHRANFTYKAIELPAGEHTVEWVYDPWPVKILYSLFYLFLGAVAVIICVRLKTKKRQS